MSQLIEQLVDWLVPFLCGGAVTVLGLMRRWGRAIINGMRELLLCQLEDLRREMVIEHDGVADEDLKSRSQRLYDSYHWAATATAHPSTTTSNPRQSRRATEREPRNPARLQNISERRTHDI